MKARLLKKLLNNTNYTISNQEDYIAVGTGLCHKLFNVNKKDMTIRYALDTFGQGRKCFEKKSPDETDLKLLFIWDKLHELVDAGKMREIINGKDEIDNPLPVFTVDDGKLIESKTDFYGYPNIDDDGNIMYENTHFPTKEQAIEYGISEWKSYEENLLNRIKGIESDLSKAKSLLDNCRSDLLNLENLQLIKS